MFNRKVIKNQKLTSCSTKILSLACIILPLQYSSSVQADNPCMKVYISAEVQLIRELTVAPDPIGFGDVKYVYEDGSMGNALATLFLAEPLKYTEDGTIHVTINASHDFGNADSIVWKIDQVHTPTTIPGEYTLNERINIIDGTGIYADSFGRGTAHGGSSFITFGGFIEGKARVCGTLQ